MYTLFTRVENVLPLTKDTKQHQKKKSSNKHIDKVIVHIETVHVNLCGLRRDKNIDSP